MATLKEIKEVLNPRIEEDIIQIGYCKSCTSYHFNLTGSCNYCHECGEKLEQRTYRRIK